MRRWRPTSSIAILTFTTYTLGGLAREQVCIYMCPWPRIQGAMLDEDSLVVSYHPDRGEPRGAHKQGDVWGGRGDCIDCNQCVAVCPMGIDIRNGQQMECITCALCIDACDDVMAKIDRPKGLISYDTLANMDRRAQGKPARLRLVRPRTIMYAAFICIVGAVMLYALATRSVLALDVLRDRNPLYVTLSNGDIRNGYTHQDHQQAARAAPHRPRGRGTCRHQCRGDRRRRRVRHRSAARRAAQRARVRHRAASAHCAASRRT